MGFSVPSNLPAAPPYGLPPNVIRASYALNLIQTDAFQFATSRRKVCNLFTIAPLPGGGSEARVAEFIFYPLPTANGTLEIAFYGEAVELKVASLTDGLDVTISAGSPDVYSGQLTGLSNVPQLLRILVTDRGGGSLIALFIFEASLTAAELP
jgi:hypothetical protein